MKRLFGLALAVLATASAATDFNPAQALAQRTGIPATEIATVLKNCDANQTNMNLCAQFEQLKAEHALDVAAGQKQAACPHCKGASPQAMSAWRKQRDRACSDAAQKAWGNGSMRPAATAMCITAATQEKLKKLRPAQLSWPD